MEDTRGGVWTVKDVCAHLKVHQTSIYRMLKQTRKREGDYLPAFRVGSDWRFFKDDVIAYFKRRQTNES